MSSIDSQEPRSEREIFLEALEKTEGAERDAFLATIGSDDPALRAAVEELLRNHKNDDFMESTPSPGHGDANPAPADGATVVVAGERPGDRLGPYKLLQRIGEGGVGIVFMAEQETPVRRRVALKVLKPGMDTRSVIARFESERQALALMDHPNIARVLDAGSTAAGRPFFVMDLVRGTRITEYCDQNQLPTRERLELFAQVCEAIQHAHQKGIIHRDIKPSNILVTLQDGKPVPKVIDFGIAKALAMDIRRYLRNEPVLARPPSTTYRLSKFISRNKIASTAVAGITTALAIGLGVSTWQWAEKSEAYRRVALSEQVEVKLRKEAYHARQVAETQAAVARRRAYAADMNLTGQALSVNNLGRARELLARHWPEEGAGETSQQVDLRGWEWRYLWQQCRSDALFTLCRGSNAVSSLSVGPDGLWVALGEYGDGGLSIWDLRTRQEIARFPAGEGGEPLLCSPTQSLLAFASWFPNAPPGAGGSRGKSVVRLWDGDARRVTAELPLTAKCQAMAFSPDGAQLLTITDDLTVTLWDVSMASRLSTVKLDEPPTKMHGGLRVWAISRDLEWLACSGWGGGQLRVLSLTTGQELWSATAADENVVALAFSQDGSVLASSGGYVELSVRLWNVRGGHEFARLEGHRTYVRSLVFWPDGRTLASASGDQTVHLWDI
jgi:tRNA A-37 threonylcarbamoyl transferase component Bud32